MNNITAKELAQKLGLSAAAVSLALNGKAGVSDKTREIILQEAKNHGLNIALNVEDTQKGQAKTICYLVVTDKYVKSGEHSMFESLVLYGVDNACHNIGYNTLVKYIDVTDLLNQNVIDMIKTVDGLIILAADINKSNVEDLQKLLQIVKDVPKIILDSMILQGKEDSIGSDNFSGGALAAHALLESGCQNIGYLRSKTRILNFDERQTGFEHTLRSLGKNLYTVVNVGLSSNEAFEDITAWLSTKPKMPDGFFADNDVLAISALRAIKAAGYNVPDDVSIIGFDDLPIAQMCEPPLSTIKCSKEGLGIAAVFDLYAKINVKVELSQGIACKKTYMTPSFIKRSSTK